MTFQNFHIIHFQMKPYNSTQQWKENEKPNQNTYIVCLFIYPQSNFLVFLGVW